MKETARVYRAFAAMFPETARQLELYPRLAKLVLTVRRLPGDRCPWCMQGFGGHREGCSWVKAVEEVSRCSL